MVDLQKLDCVSSRAVPESTWRRSDSTYSNLIAYSVPRVETRLVPCLLGFWVGFPRVRVRVGGPCELCRIHDWPNSTVLAGNAQHGGRAYRSFLEGLEGLEGMRRVIRFHIGRPPGVGHVPGVQMGDPLGSPGERFGVRNGSGDATGVTARGFRVFSSPPAADSSRRTHRRCSGQ